MLRAVGFVVLAAFLAVAAYRSGFVRFNYPDQDRYPVAGIDVSHHQGDVDWPTVAAGGIDFAFIKATEGGDHRDREFATNWAGTAEAGIPRGAYHFFTFCADGGSQAENFLSVVPKPGELPSVADVEFVGNCETWTSVQTIRGDLQHFLEAVESAHGRRPIIYTTSDGRERILQDRFDAYPLWIRSVFAEPKTPAA